MSETPAQKAQKAMWRFEELIKTVALTITLSEEKTVKMFLALNEERSVKEAVMRFGLEAYPELTRDWKAWKLFSGAV